MGYIVVMRRSTKTLPTLTVTVRVTSPTYGTRVNVWTAVGRKGCRELRRRAERTVEQVRSLGEGYDATVTETV